mgnify:FL=1
MGEEKAVAEASQPKQKSAKSSHPLEPDVVIDLRNRIRELFPVYGRRNTMLTVAKEFGVSERTAYTHISKVIYEDFKDVDKGNVISEILSGFEFRKRQLWRLYLDEEGTYKDKDGKDVKKKPNKVIQLGALKQLNEEDRTKVALLQELGQIEMPTERLEHSGEFYIGNVLNKIQDRINRRKVRVRELEHHETV